MHHPLCVSARQPQIHLTHEQQQILSHDIQPDHVVKIVAFAGKLAAVTAQCKTQASVSVSFALFLFTQVLLKL